MDQREVETMIKSLQKALAENGVTDVTTILEKLKKEVVPTEDLLRVCFGPFKSLPTRFVDIS
jgi:hypothetical protein